MPWPGITDFTEAVQNPALCFRGTDLEAGQVAPGLPGKPLMYSGNFAAVYKVSVGERTHAVRCFTRQVSDQQARYGALSNHLRTFLSPSFVDFEYVERGILIKGEWYPIVKMEWVDGDSLNKFVEFVGAGLVVPDTLRQMAAQWRGGPVASLRGLRIAHNDLQHGNVMVQTDGNIRLVDYDGMYLREFQGQPSPELGHKNYQHPLRSPHHYDENVDNFPSLVIYLSLLAIAADPSLWEFHNEDNLIFTKGDYADPANSELFARLKRSPDEAVIKLAERLEEYCGLPLEEVPDLETVLQDVPPSTATPSPTPPPAPTPQAALRPPAPTKTGESYRETLRGRQTTPPAPAPPAPTPPAQVPNPPQAPAPPGTPATASPGRKLRDLKRVMLWVGGVTAAVFAVFIVMIALASLNAEDTGANGVTGPGGGSGASAGSGASGSSGASGGASNGASGGSGATVPPSLPAAIPGDETTPTVSLELSSSSIGENGGSATLTASLSSPSSATTTLTVSVEPGPGADSSDYTLSRPTLTIRAGATTSADSLTVSAIDNTTDAPDKTVTIYGGASNALGAVDPAAVTLTITDDDGAPTVTLELSPSSISENGGAANVTASLSAPTSQDVILVVSAVPEPSAAGSYFTITSSKTLTIAAGSTVSTDVVTITAIDNGVDEPDKSVTVSATIGGSRDVTPPSSRTLTITDDDATPTVTLSLSSSSISENGGTANVTATLSRPSWQAVTLAVFASPESHAVSGDFAVSSNNSLTIEAGSTQSSGTVTITAVDNSVDEPHKYVTVSASATGHGVAARPSLTLAITDDDGAPAVALDLSPSSIDENGGVAVVTATLSPPSSQPVTVVVSASPEPPAVDGDFTISSGRSLTIAAGSTSAAGTVSITAVDNSVDGPDKYVTVSATVTGRDVAAPPSRTLTITDDEAAPTVTLALSSPSIGENGGVTDVTATLSGPSSEDVTIAISASPTSHAAGDDFTITPDNTLTIAAGSTHSTGNVTITAVDNSVDEPDKSVTVSASVTGYDVADPSSLTLAITDDEATPVTLELSTHSISENGGTTDVTASLGVPSSQDVTVVVSATPMSPAVEGDFTISPNTTLTIEAGSTHSTDAVTITAVDNSVDGPDKSVTVSATVTGHDVTAPSSLTLTITDDEGAPAATLVLSSSSISENGGAASVTATLSGPSSQDVTLVVSASPDPPALGDDFTITSNKTLTIEAGSTRSTGVVTIEAVDDSVDGPDKSLTISATVTGRDVTAPSSQTLTITDDEDTPTLALELSTPTISENGDVANVTAYLSGPSSQDTTVTVSVSPISPAVEGDFTISPNTILTIAAGSTHSTDAVTITAVDNRVDAPHKSVTVSATVTGRDVSAPSDLRLTIRDDDDAPTLTLELSSNSISENGGTANITASLSDPYSEDVILVVSASPNPPTVSGDFTITSNKTLTIAAGSTDSTGTVTITAVNNSADEEDKQVYVWATVSDSPVINKTPLQVLVITDDDSA